MKYRVTPKHIDAVLQRMPRAKGAAKLRRIMSGDTKVLLSKLEKGFIARLTEADLPLPETNNEREREAYARGDQFRRYTYKDVFEEPARMLEELRKLLT